MEATTSWFDSVLDAVWKQMVAGIDFLPNLLAAMIILAIGWAIARLARATMQRLALASNRLLDRAFPRGALASARISSATATLIGEFVFWVIVLIAVTIASGIAGLSAVSEWLDRITAYLPNLIAGVTIVVIGYFLSVFVREQVAPQATAAASRQSLLLGRIAQGFVISTALIVGLDQVGIDVALLVALAVVCVAAALTGLAVAFALGARSHVSNLIGVRAASRHMSAGVRIRIQDIEGEILEITPTQIALNTDQGKTLVPGKFIDDHVVTIVSPDSHRDAEDV